MPKDFIRGNIMDNREYLVNGLIATGTSNLFIGKSGTGKSYLAFNLAVAVAIGQKFIGLDTKKGKVLIVDEEQAIDDSNSRVANLLNKYEVYESPNIITAFREGLQLKDNSLIKAINDVNPDVVIIDSLTSISKGLNMGSTNDSQYFANLHQDCKNRNITIVTIHHISTHTQLNYNSFLVCDAAGLSMNSTVFINAVDAFFVLYNPNVNKNIDRLYIRPNSKRYKINYGVVETGMIQTDKTLIFKDIIPVEVNTDEILTVQEEIIMGILEDENDSGIKIKDLYEKSNGRIGLNRAYEYAEELKLKGMIQCKNVGNKKNLYTLTDSGKRYIATMKIMNGITDDGGSKKNKNNEFVIS